jgi:hypothetical protein
MKQQQHLAFTCTQVYQYYAVVCEQILAMRLIVSIKFSFISPDSDGRKAQEI